MTRSRASKTNDILGRIWGGLPVRDAPYDATLPISTRHWAEAIPGIYDQCAMALCAKDLFGSQAVAFFRTRAYMDMVDPADGVRWVNRYMYGPGARETVVSLDSHPDVRPTQTTVVILKAPRPGETLEAQAVREQRRHEKIKNGQHAIIQGTNKGRVKPQATILDLNGVRKGTGMVHFEAERA